MVSLLFTSINLPRLIASGMLCVAKSFLPLSRSALDTLFQLDRHSPREDGNLEEALNRRGREEVLYIPPILSLLPSTTGLTTTTAKFADPLWTESALPSIDTASLALHGALHQFRPVSDDYALVPYSEAFNWSEIKLPSDLESSWFCVVFRSRRKPWSNSIDLYDVGTYRLLHHLSVRSFWNRE